MKIKSIIFAVLVAGVSSGSYGAGDQQPDELVDLTTATAGSVVSITYDSGDYKFPFDNSVAGINNRWLVLTSNKSGMYVTYKFNEPTAVNGYGIANGGAGCNTQTERAPKSWILEASNDNETWTPLDSRNDETGWASAEFRYYRCNNATKYTYYRFTCLASNGNGYVQIHEIYYYYNISFALEDCSAERNADGSCLFSCTVKKDAVDSVTAYAKTDDDAKMLSMSLGTSVAADTELSGSLSGFESGLSYELLIVGQKNDDKDDVGVGTMYAGELAIVLDSNAQELGCVPGRVKVSRANASKFPLVVNYTLTDGTAQVGVDYVAGSGTITIPENEKDGYIEVVPLVNPDKTSDTALTVSLTTGNYAVPAGDVTMAIVNAAIPADKNVWVAGSTSDGLASTASNWSKGVPNESMPETLVILVDGNYSSHDMTWDADNATLAKTVSSWTQTALYTGTVTINTEFETYAGASFTCLTVTGDVNLQGGTWTHPVSIYQTSGNPYTLEQMRANAHYRMNVDVKGDFTIAAGAKLSADSKGYWRYATGYNIYGSHGGYRNSSTMEPYGDVRHPVDIGSCTCAGTDNKGKAAAGGGAVHLVVGGALTVDGVISADGNGNGAGGSSAGSVYVAANAVAGSGAIHASGIKPSSDKEAGAGGRVAVISTTTIADTLILAATAGGACYSGAGTVYVKSAADTHGRLFIANTLNTQVGYNCRTPITDGDWTFDSIYVDQCAKLHIGEGKTLTLPNGLASVHGGTGSAAYNGILLDGGTLVAGDGDQTMSGKWTFESTKPFTFPGSLSLVAGARIGLFRLLQSGTNNVLTCDYTINGDLTIDKDSSVDVSQIYHSSGVNGSIPPSLHGGWSAYDNPSKNYPCASNTYDSVFHPHLPGMTPNKSYYGSGVLKLQVAGVLTVDGTIGAYGSVSDSTSDNMPAAPGGSIDIVAGSLSGSGKIDASGAAGRYNYAGGGGGGRIAVRLTQANADFSAAPLINAQGQVGNPANANFAKSVKFASAGSVYLQTAAEGEKKGTMIVSNFNHPLSDFTDFITSGRRWPTTPIIAYGPGADESSDFREVSLVVTNTAIAEVSVETLKMKTLTIAANSKLDLFGNTLTVGRAKLGGTKLAAGTYTAADYSDYLSDSGEGGQLVVTGGGFVMYLR